MLLIDEIDVFFQNSFFGATHNPACTVHSDHTVALMRHVWDNRGKTPAITMQDVYDLPAYAGLAGDLIPEAL